MFGFFKRDRASQTHPVDGFILSLRNGNKEAVEQFIAHYTALLTANIDSADKSGGLGAEEKINILTALGDAHWKNVHVPRTVVATKQDIKALETLLEAKEDEYYLTTNRSRPDMTKSIQQSNAIKIINLLMNHMDIMETHPHPVDRAILFLRHGYVDEFKQFVKAYTDLFTVKLQKAVTRANHNENDFGSDDATNILPTIIDQWSNFDNSRQAVIEASDIERLQSFIDSESSEAARLTTEHLKKMKPGDDAPEMPEEVIHIHNRGKVLQALEVYLQENAPTETISPGLKSV